MNPLRQKQLEQFLQRLGLSLADPVRLDLLDLALTHPTASLEANYERLEFVGDAVVKLAAGEFLFVRYPNAPEGELSAIRSMLVSDRTLAEIAQSYGFERFLLVGGSARGNQAGQQTRLASALEAVLAALFLSSQDLSLIHPWLDGHLAHHSDIIRHDPTFKNYKGALQILTQERYQTRPDYRVIEIGQTYGDRERFEAEVWLAGKKWGQGRGKSKKAAEQAAAERAFLELQAFLAEESKSTSERSQSQESDPIP
jgi:ribonuclease-3